MRVNKQAKLIFFALLAVVLAALLAHHLQHHPLTVLDAKGPIAQKERNLFVFALVLSAVVVLPVYAMTVAIIWKYRESNPRTKTYRPDWDHSHLFEAIWWGIPCLIILVLSIITWNSSYSLDPYKPLNADRKTLTVDVVALDWKWLFVYPGQNVASVNLLQIPTDVPVHFNITSDTVMNSFWIPNLGSQIYAMPGMNAELNLQADKAGDYRGSSSNISGRDFAKMHFVARASSLDAFHAWVNRAKKSSSMLDMPAYKKLSTPGTAVSFSTYSGVDRTLYADTILKYMTPDDHDSGSAE